MEDEPPFLFDPLGSEIAVSTDIDGTFIDIAARGPWRRHLAGTLHRTFQKCLAECPTGIIVDLTAVDDPSAESVATWVTIARIAAATEPPTHVALCLPTHVPLRRRLARVGNARFIVVCETPAGARAALSGKRPLLDVIRLRLPPSPTSLSVARNLIGGACQEWGMPNLLHPGRAVVSELVANAVEHARTEMDITVSRRGSGLHLAVRDRNPTLPRMLKMAPIVDGGPLDERGRGLRVVHADTLAWGAMPTSGGKLVWATIRDRAGRPRGW
ncbi:ATP-binding protein [Actinoplanes sp. NPDC051494]|uniref:ATP-binding protein n=1 Tax=Actinoplanes sp. NPDC051494 TaxID=3363907 RepID=UPI00378B6B00